MISVNHDDNSLSLNWVSCKYICTYIYIYIYIFEKVKKNSTFQKYDDSSRSL